MLAVCLAHLDLAIRATDVSDHEIVVVDNASERPLARAMPLAPPYRVLRCDTHHGFGAGCNLGARAARGDFLLFLNNDVLLRGDVLARMLRAFVDHPALGICGARLLFPDGSIQHAGVLMAPPPTGPYHLNRKGPPEHVAVERERFQAVTGACMLVPRATFAALGGFDESFGFGYEDVDLCLRARRAGYDVRCVQRSCSLHFESLTPGRVELGGPSLGQFFARWEGRYTIDG